MIKIAFIGAGSMVFTRCLTRDILSYPALAGATIALMDIDQERLGYAKTAVESLIAAGNYPAKIQATLSRAEALKGADIVVVAILSHPLRVWKHDILIPKKYGVDICVGDTRGPAGIFRALRTIPVMLDICRDVERYCPQAVLLNYTNPMTMICRAMQAESPIRSFGLCHSVQGTVAAMARWIGAPLEEISCVCAGINHQAWVLEFLWKGRDAYPLLREAMKRPEVHFAEYVQNELFLHLDYFVTESSGHHSEYVPWFRKRPDLIKKYCSKTKHSNWNPGEHAFALHEYMRSVKTWKQTVRTWLASDEVADTKRSPEYAAAIINAIHGDHTPTVFNGNVRNFGLIDNLPAGSCVEVPITASRNGFLAAHIGALPPQLAILNGINAACEDLAAQAAVSGDPRMVFHAVAFDPLTSSVLSLPEIKKMVDEMFKASKPYLPQFKHVS